MRYKFLTLVLVICWVVCVLLLVSGSSLLGYSLIGRSFPLGTLIIWVGLVTLPLALYTAFQDLRKPGSWIDKFFRKALQAILILAGSWGILAFLLSGNWAFNFNSNASGFSGSGQASWLFWKITYLTVVAEWFFIVIYMLSKWLKRVRNFSNQK